MDEQSVWQNSHYKLHQQQS